MSAVRTLTVDDDLALSRVGYERGEVLQPDTGSSSAHRYRVDITSSLVADGLVRLESTDARLRFLDTNGLAADRARPASVPDPAQGHGRPSDGRLSCPCPTRTRARLPTASPDLVELRDDALDNDLLDGVDFAVVGVSGSVGGRVHRVRGGGRRVRSSPTVTRVSRASCSPRGPWRRREQSSSTRRAGSGRSAVGGRTSVGHRPSVPRTGPRRR